jgi:hypothetical protein
MDPYAFFFSCRQKVSRSLCWYLHPPVPCCRTLLTVWKW